MPRPSNVSTWPPGPAHVEPPPALAVDDALEAGVVVRRVVLDVELRLLERDDAGRLLAAACGHRRGAQKHRRHERHR